MSRTRFTPGPWKVFGRDNTLVCVYKGHPDKAVVQWNGFDASAFPKQNFANAKLIAKAPEMFALLERAVNDRIDDAWLRSTRRLLDAAQSPAPSQEVK